MCLILLGEFDCLLLKSFFLFTQHIIAQKVQFVGKQKEGEFIHVFCSGINANGNLFQSNEVHQMGSSIN